MKRFTLLVLSIAFFASCSTSVEKENVDTPATEQVENEIVTGFDSVRAAKVGADPYGMRKYVIAFLKKGPNRDLDSLQAADLQAAHMANIGKMAEAGKLALAGPFFGDGDLRGIYIFAVESIEEAEALTNSDPAIEAGSLVMDLKEWYGSAALMEVNEIHGQISKIEI